MTTQMTPQRIALMPTIHFRIDETTKRLAMQAAERLNISLTELMRQRAEQLAAEERAYQAASHERWLEAQIAEAFERYDGGETTFISDEEAKNHMDRLKTLAAKGEL